MIYRIYGLRSKSTGHTFNIGQTHQELAARRNQHIKNAKRYVKSGCYGLKSNAIVRLIDKYGEGDIEIFEIETIEAEPSYYDRLGRALSSKVVNEREQYWQYIYASRGTTHCQWQAIITRGGNMSYKQVRLTLSAEEFRKLELLTTQI